MSGGGNWAESAARVRAAGSKLRPLWIAIGVLTTLLGIAELVSTAIGVAGVLDDVPGQLTQELFLVIGISLLVLTLVLPRVRAGLVHRGISTKGATWTVTLGFLALFAIGCYGLFSGSPTAQSEEGDAHASGTINVPVRIGTDCEPQNPKEAGNHEALQRAVAYVKCEPTGSGAETVDLVQFDSKSDLSYWLETWKDHLEPPYGICEGGPGYLDWTDRKGVPQGEVLCGSREDTNHIIWTDESKMLLGEAYASENFASDEWLYIWWTDHVRDPEPFPSGHDRRLLAVARQSIHAGDCVRASEMPAAALAVIYCDSPRLRSGGATGADGLQITAFASESSLSEYFDLYASTYARFAGSEDRCSQSVLARGDWSAGEFACFPAGGSQWFAWTNEDENIFALIRRDDDNVKALYNAWKSLIF